jgi:Tol biopolymer transport system component
MRKFVTSTIVVTAWAVSASHAQTLRKVLEFPKEYAASISLDDAGAAVYAVSSTNQFGTNPGYLKQIVRWDPTTGAGVQITDFEEGVESVSVNDDGTWLAFVSRADPLGTNHDESAEVFVMHPDGTSLAQLTSESFAAFDLLTGSRGVSSAVISGSGNRVAFVGRINPLGSNSTYKQALFVIDRGGTNLRLLRTDVQPATNTWFVGAFARLVDQSTFDISDDGSKLVYISGSVGGINANGTGGHSFTSTSQAQSVALSGNGNKIVYTVGTAPSSSVSVRTFDGNPGTIVGLGQGERAWITDDATSVTLYRPALAPDPAGIWRVASTGGPKTLITQNLKTLGVSGDGSRIVARGAELFAVDGAGANLQQLTTTSVTPDAPRSFALSSNGSMVSFQSSIDPLGTNPAHDEEWFSYDLDTGQFWQRTGAGAPLPTDNPVVSADDGSVFFVAGINPTGENSCATRQLFRLSPGGVTTQLTYCGDPPPYVQSDYPNFLGVRPDGAAACFISLDVNNLRYGTYTVRGDGTGRTDLGFSATPRSPSVAGTGAVSWVALATDAGLFRVKADGTGVQQITTESIYDFPSISADGSVIAWPSGTEDSVWREATQAITQIPGNYPAFRTPMVTQDAQWVFSEWQRYHVPSGPSEFVRGGLPDATGARWVSEESDLTISPSPDFDVTTGSKTTLWLADLNALPAFVVGKTSPTELTWDASPFSLRYDVVRGSIANLSIAGSTVNLGPVSCLEDDSPDNHTKGYGDPVQPAPGQAFFYLYRGSVGFDAAVGSYGQGSGGKERIAGTGGCNP